MKRIILAVLLGCAALIAAVLAGRQATGYLRSQVTTTHVVVARQPLAPYTTIHEDMLALQEVPEQVAAAPVFTRTADLRGRLALVEIPAGVPIYQANVRLAGEVRFTSDADAVVLSLPVDTVRALGGLLQAGQRVDVWRIAKSRPGAEGLAPEELLELNGAAAELLASDVRVLAVKSSGGVSQVAQEGNGGAALPGLAVPAAGQQTEQSSNAGSRPGAGAAAGRPAGAESISIVTLEVSQETAPVLLQLAGELSDRYDVWLTLAPLTRQPLAARPTPTRVATVANNPTPTTTPSPTPLPPAALASPVVTATLPANSAAPLPSPTPTFAPPIIVAPTAPTSSPTAAPTATAVGPEFVAELEYRNEPGDKGLNYVRARAVATDGSPLAGAITMSWPDGAVACPGDQFPKADGWCEFIATEGTFTLQLAILDAPTVAVNLPQRDQHTVALVTWRKVR